MRIFLSTTCLSIFVAGIFNPTLVRATDACHCFTKDEIIEKCQARKRHLYHRGPLDQGDTYLGSSILCWTKGEYMLVFELRRDGCSNGRTKKYSDDGIREAHSTKSSKNAWNTDREFYLKCDGVMKSAADTIGIEPES